MSPNDKATPSHLGISSRSALLECLLWRITKLLTKVSQKQLTDVDQITKVEMFAYLPKENVLFHTASHRKMNSVAHFILILKILKVFYYFIMIYNKNTIWIFLLLDVFQLMFNNFGLLIWCLYSFLSWHLLFLTHT